VISGDGRLIAFVSEASNLVSGDTNGLPDVFVRDLETGKTELVSLTATGAPADGASFSPAISRDGNVIAFASNAGNLVPGDTNGTVDIFVRDRRAGTTERVSVSAAGLAGNGPSLSPAISDDGQVVAFQSVADNLVPGDANGEPDIFVRERPTGRTELVSAGAGGAAADGWSELPAISGDGSVIAFASSAGNLAPGDRNGAWDVFVRDRRSGKTEIASVTATGEAGAGSSLSASISGDGRFVAFLSEAGNLVAGGTAGSVDVFVRDRQTGTTERVSESVTGEAGNGWSGSPAISGDGRFVAFVSEATNLVAGDTNSRRDVFVVERQ
jgi:Tol biopolymer transport system component